MIAAYAFLSIYALWVFYVAVMHLKRCRDNGTLSRAALYLGYPILFIGYLLDIFVQVFIASVIFLERRHLLPWSDTFSAKGAR